MQFAQNLGKVVHLVYWIRTYDISILSAFPLSVQLGSQQAVILLFHGDLK